MDVTKAVAQEATPELDNDILSRMIKDVTSEVLEQEAPSGERKDPTIDVNAQPKVTGERVPQWERRSFRAIHGILKSQSKDHQEKLDGLRTLQEYDRQTRSITAWQRDDEDNYAAETIASSGLSKRVQKRLHSTLTGPAGEFALPKPFLAELFVYIETYGHARRLARVVPMGSKDLDLKSIATKPSATWTGEAVLLTESDLALGEIKLSTNKLGAITSITKEQD